MGYFEEIGKRIGHVSKSAVKKAAAIADGAGLSMQINGLERERDRICRDLGAAYFARHGTAPEPELVLVPVPVEWPEPAEAVAPVLVSATSERSPA